jgi:hypothetical protein
VGNHTVSFVGIDKSKWAGELEHRAEHGLSVAKLRKILFLARLRNRRTSLTRLGVPRSGSCPPAKARADP